jgi:hypothetical protein
MQGTMSVFKLCVTRSRQGERAPFLHLECYLRPFLLCEQDVAICTFPGNLVKFNTMAELQKSGT